ncbi:UDP-glucuronic acid decarboxylase 1-like isoform X2 [Phyllobates terribilis]|uniref:UDP-glucuronic acid decarboxylase 1-like isoform X2 n=1 Tax=Phyllobates terribilis TaxID=111132 RepID=UPI003CCA9E72
MCYSYMKQEGVEVRVARTFNTFGPRMHMNDGRVVSNFVLQALQGEPLTVYGSGSQTRAFQYVSDLVNGLVGLMNSNVSSPVNLVPLEEGLNKTIHYFSKELEYQANNQYIPKPKPERIKKGRMRHN